MIPFGGHKEYYAAKREKEAEKPKSALQEFYTWEAIKKVFRDIFGS
jgi:hypothetical protein